MYLEVKSLKFEFLLTFVIAICKYNCLHNHNYYNYTHLHVNFVNFTL